jgi:alkaline phosphatase
VRASIAAAFAAVALCVAAPAIVAPAAAPAAATSPISAAPAAAPAPAAAARPRSLILVIGDGFGWGALSVAEVMLPRSTLLSGAESVGSVTTYACGELVTGSPEAAAALAAGRRIPPERGELVTDSAAAATALSTGKRTRNAWLGVECDDPKPMRTLAEEAAERGLAVGLLTTVPITHATPAAFYSHITDREKALEIAAQLVDFPFAFVAGGGRSSFVPRAQGGERADERDLLADLRRRGVSVAVSVEEAKRAPNDRPLALLYDAGDPPVAGPGRPSLSSLVEEALRRVADDPEGFFLMVEGGQIDWAEHDRDAGALVKELADFEPAVARLRAFAAERGGIALAIVADHDTGAPAPWQDDEPGSPVEIRFLTDEHTALLVPLLVNGPPAREWTRVRHLTDLNAAMRRWLLENR